MKCSSISKSIPRLSYVLGYYTAAEARKLHGSALQLGKNTHVGPIFMAEGRPPVARSGIHLCT
jgi:hypothetical protein